MRLQILAERFLEHEVSFSFRGKLPMVVAKGFNDDWRLGSLIISTPTEWEKK